MVLSTIVLHNDAATAAVAVFTISAGIEPLASCHTFGRFGGLPPSVDPLPACKVYWIPGATMRQSCSAHSSGISPFSTCPFFRRHGLNVHLPHT